MELPDDILFLIREYSKPLKRRIISDYWIESNIFEFDNMLNHVFQSVCDCFYDKFPYGTFKPIIMKEGSHYDITYNVFCLSFNEKSLMIWNGEYEYLDGNNWLLGKDHYHKQLLKDDKIIQSQKWFNGIKVSDCICNGSGRSYWCDDVYGPCTECCCERCEKKNEECECNDED